jgi:hypothetical protein
MRAGLPGSVITASPGTSPHYRLLPSRTPATIDCVRGGNSVMCDPEGPAIRTTAIPAYLNTGNEHAAVIGAWPRRLRKADQLGTRATQSPRTSGSTAAASPTARPCSPTERRVVRAIRHRPVVVGSDETKPGYREPTATTPINARPHPSSTARVATDERVHRRALATTASGRALTLTPECSCGRWPVPRTAQQSQRHGKTPRTVLDRGGPCLP